MKLKIFTFIMSFLMIFTISSITLNATDGEYITPNVITQSSSIEEDMALLEVDLTEIEAGADKDDRILTFGNMYYEQSGNILSEIVMYYYSPNFKLNYDYLYVDLEATYLEKDNVSSDVASWPTGLSCWKIIKISDLGIYKLKYDSECYTGNNPITELIKVFDKVQFTTRAIGTSVARVSNATEATFYSNAFVVVKNQHFQLLNEFSSEDNTRSFSSVGYDENYVVVDGVCIGYTFDAGESLWDEYIKRVDNQFDLYLMFFNVETNGEKWTTSKEITKINLTYIESQRQTTGVVNLPSSESTTIGESTTLSQTIENKAYTFTYPKDCIGNSFNLWLDFKVIENEVTYKGIWNLSDSDWSDELSKSSDFDASEFSDYTFALHYGSMQGYDRTTTTQAASQMDYFTTDWTLAYVEDVIDITYIKDGVAYCVQVDETNVEFGGFVNDGDGEAPVITDEGKSFWEELFEKINNFFNSGTTKAVVAIIVCVAAVVLVFSIWSKVATIQALRKKK